MKFLKCTHCGNMVGFVEDKGVPILCCGEAMKALIPGEIDAAAEKHIPVVSIDGNKVVVTVGEVAHPMTNEHSIKWIALQTKMGNQRKVLLGEPCANFRVCDGDEVVCVYAYCDLHGLWKKEL